MRKITLIIGLVFIVFANYAQVKVYPNPDPQNTSGYNLQSAVFKVEVIQNGKTQESFVYSSKTNFEKPEQQTDFNHWTTFERSGKVEICVTRLDGNIEEAKIMPSRLNISATIKKNQLRFTLNQSAKILVDIKGMEEHPLFIFADDIEKARPSKKDKNVIWFEAGKVHNVGLQYKVPNGATIYIEGGAVVWGTFWCEDGTKQTTVKGKGVITTVSSERKPNAQNIPFCTVYGVKTDMFIDGITITDPVKFCILGRSKVSTTNVKLFAWYHQTDGWGGGDDSFIDNSFIKVFDDNVKLYGNHQKATDLVIYQQHNGAPFQLSWGGQSGRNCIADGIDIVKCFVKKNGGSGNSGLLNLRKGSDRFIGDITIKNVRVDGDIYQILGFGSEKTSDVANISIENITVTGKQQQLSYIDCTKGGSVKNVVFKNVMINGKCFTSADIKLDNLPAVAVKIICN